MPKSRHWYTPWRSSKVETKSVVLGTSEALGSFLIFGHGKAATASSALALYDDSSAVSIPVNMVADAFTIMEPVLLVDRKIVRSSPVLDLLNNPSPYYTRELFQEFLGKEYLITGECSFIGLGGTKRPPLELQPISVKNLQVVEGVGGVPHNIHVSGNTLAGVYRPEIKNGHLRYIDTLRELTQIRNYNTRSNSLLRGQSVLLAASRDVRQHVLGGTHNISILEKGGRMSVIFHFEDDMDDEDFEAAKQRVREQYGGSSNAGEIGVTAGSQLKINNLGSSSKDMDFAILQRMAIKATTLVLRVPLPLVTDERQTLNNYRQGILALYDDAVIPLSKKIYGGIGDAIFPRFGMDPRTTRITFDPDQISALVERRIEEIKKRASIGVESDNEIRSLLGIGPYEGGDVILKQSSLIPAGIDVDLEDPDSSADSGFDI